MRVRLSRQVFVTLRKSAPLLLAATLACEKDKADVSRDPCLEVHRKFVALDQESPFGFVPAEVLGAIEGTHSAPMTWTPLADTLSVSPASGETTLTVTVARNGEGEGAWVTFKPNPYLVSASRECPEQLQIASQLDVTTQDGALNESSNAVLRLQSDGIVSVTKAWALESIVGSFAVDRSKLGAGNATLEFDSSITRYGLSGVMGLRGQSEVEGWVTSSLAYWPAGNCGREPLRLPVALDEPVGSETIPTGTAALTLARAIKSATLSFVDGRQTPIALNIDSTQSLVCAYPEISGGFELVSTLGLRNPDGSLDRTYEGALVVESSAADAVKLKFACGGKLKNDEFFERCADWGFDVSGNNLGRIEIDAVVSAASTLTGTVRVMASSNWSCSNYADCPLSQFDEVATIALQGGSG